MLLGVLATAAAAAQQRDATSGAAPGPQGPAAVRGIPLEDVARIVDRFGDAAPPPLSRRHGAELASAWSAWTGQRLARLRERLARGDEDTLVNLWLFGTSFTRRPPARPGDLAAAGGEAVANETIERRLDELVDFLASKSADSRARFGRELMEARGIDLASADGRRRARGVLEAARRRILAENRATDRELDDARAEGGPAAEAAAHATIFENRGLSSDTSILPAFAVDQALEALQRAGALRTGSVRRVAVVGPGLDVINKSAGHDFYPPQTIQPFAVADSLLRLGLAPPGTPQVTTFDVNPRVNAHLRDAVTRARAGEGYRINLTLPLTESWTGDLVRYFERWGARVGAPAPEVAAPMASVRVRPMAVRPAAVAAVRPVPLDIVLERLDLPPAGRFDLVIATNVFVYYDGFEQALALANVAAMLQPGGSLLSNTPLPAAGSMRPEIGQLEVAYSDRQFDRVFWYRPPEAVADGGAGAAR